MKTAKSIKISKLILLLIGMGFLFVGCEKRNISVPSQEAPKDPVTLLKEHIQKLRTQPHSDPADVSSVWSNISYDVQKSDSLVSPYVGEIEMYETKNGEPYLHYSVFKYEKTFWFGYKIRLAFQQGRWIVKQGQKKIFASDKFYQYYEDYTKMEDYELTHIKIALGAD